MADLLHGCVRERAPTRNIFEEFADIGFGRSIGRPMRQQQDGFHTVFAPAFAYFAARSCTNSTSIFTFCSGVSGRIPCPRLKMCPVRPPERRKISSAADETCSQDEKSTTGSRFPCTAHL